MPLSTAGTFLSYTPAHAANLRGDRHHPQPTLRSEQPYPVLSSGSLRVCAPRHCPLTQHCICDHSEEVFAIRSQHQAQGQDSWLPRVTGSLGTDAHNQSKASGQVVENA